MKLRVTLFIVIVLACGWFGKLIDLILVEQPKDQTLGSLIWLIAPIITSVLLALVHKSNYKGLGLKPRMKGNGKWYVVSIITFPGIALLTIGVGLITSSIDVTGFEIKGFVSSLFAWFLINFFRTILEETAFRGFLQERLMLLKIKDWMIYFITATVWSMWHIPYYLFFEDGNSAKLILSIFAILFSWSILYTEIYRVTRSIWPCVLLHATSNAIQYTMLENYLKVNKNVEFIISPTVSILACASAMILGLLIRRSRLCKEKQPA